MIDRFGYCCKYYLRTCGRMTVITQTEHDALPIICDKCDEKQAKGSRMKTHNLRIENLEDGKLYKNQFCAVNTGETWKNYASHEPEFYSREWFTEVADVDSTPAKTEPDELDCFTETLLRAEWVKLVDRIASDPLLDDWILDLAVARCREIRKLLTKK